MFLVRYGELENKLEINLEINYLFKNKIMVSFLTLPQRHLKEAVKHKNQPSEVFYKNRCS